VARVSAPRLFVAIVVAERVQIVANSLLSSRISDDAAS
jgi:hypothetical protein